MNFRRLRRTNTQSFKDFSEFRRHESNLVLVQTCHHEFSGNSPVQNLKLQYEISDWTRGKAKRLTGFHVGSKNLMKFYQKIRSIFITYDRRWVEKYCFQTVFPIPSLQAILPLVSRIVWLLDSLSKTVSTSHLHARGKPSTMVSARRLVETVPKRLNYTSVTLTRSLFANLRRFQVLLEDFNGF